MVNVSIEKVATMLWGEVTLLKVYDEDAGVCNATSAEILNTPESLHFKKRPKDAFSTSEHAPLDWKKF